ncbi:AmmeMemoRadiSam system radical SAM enzyme [Treponema putidum]|uniref:AmmeMemoRadiSam system radical SAM enzyme n=1 Tax=Treponema putidum TaxID=221027 RepID=A0AAE9SHI2_9SPIR|nr:AmmeMemoRadiSam system radical SAM enzyme [Treponema putidum]UTY28180.1 AmmeMemoRadiSam system radical SAM enzyme [Treponema putidum]UTY30678.1 AmmeMemoRadiSam system radical SAM enzyme [Treponema putidum]UTY33090.1 AmmeMemoRadiSam system radical SAM enzyme [Treponema putidum]
MKEAEFWKNEPSFSKKEDDKIRCLLCPHRCLIKEGQSSRCLSRKNIGGKLYSLNYGKVLGAALDPIEKKPLYHFYPSSYIFSVGTFGCNFDCLFCQNHSLVHSVPREEKIEKETDYDRVSPAELIGAVLKTPSIGIAFTYNEPTVWYEYVKDVLPLAKEKDLKTVLVTNGFIEEAPLAGILPKIDAMNIDLKSFSPQFYTKVCKGKIEPVINTIKKAASQIHIEVTCLIIEGYNSGDDEMEALSRMLSKIRADIPLHISAFYPAYKMKDKLPTKPETIRRLCKIAQKNLKYVHPGNI